MHPGGMPEFAWHPSGMHVAYFGIPVVPLRSTTG
jgi:hypothetical protein